MELKFVSMEKIEPAFSVLISTLHQDYLSLATPAALNPVIRITCRLLLIGIEPFTWPNDKLLNAIGLVSH